MTTDTAAIGGRVLERSNTIGQAEEGEGGVLCGSAAWLEEAGE